MPQYKRVSALYLDRYQLAMALAYWRDGRAESPCCFDYFFRTLPFTGGYAVFAGLGTLIDQLDSFHFGPDDLDFLSRDGFPDEFLHYLARFAFKGQILAPCEGEIIFPVEPVVRVEGTLVEAQLLETLLLNILNFQTLVATKAARCSHAAAGRTLSEFGMRRAQGLGSLWASRAACVGGFTSTSNMDAAHVHGLSPSGTIAHSYIQGYDDELTAFRKFAEVHGSSTVLLLDTYDTLRSGLPNAITVAREMKQRGLTLAGVRLDSGDLAYLSRKVREQLDKAGFTSVQIVASNQLNEHVIRSLIGQDAPIDVFGVGTSLVTGAPDAALDGVYKLSMYGDRPRLKASETVAKSTLPGRKKVLRYSDDKERFMADVIVLDREQEVSRMIHPFDASQQLDPGGWKSEELLQPVLVDGRLAREVSTVKEASDYLRMRLKRLPPEHLRFENPHIYKVGISPALRDLRDRLLQQKREEIWE